MILRNNMSNMIEIISLGSTPLSPADIPAHFQGAVVAMGNFDGVHLGHRSLIETARKWAQDKGTKLAVLTFEPHPRRVFRPDDPPFRLTPRAAKYEVLSTLGVDIVFEVAFDWALSALVYQDFIARIIAPIAPSVILAGKDFHFGRNRSGTLDHMREHGYDCEMVKLMTDPQHGVISSTRIRALIQSGHCAEANQLLGWDWFICGKVQKGDQRGREMGYPTANVALGEYIHPAYGVYDTIVQIEGYDQPFKAATNIGIRPMFELPTALVEAHILDFSGDLYGKTIKIFPQRKIRDEMHFNSLANLITQIELDCAVVRSARIQKQV